MPGDTTPYPQDRSMVTAAELVAEAKRAQLDAVPLLRAVFETRPEMGPAVAEALGMVRHQQAADLLAALNELPVKETRKAARRALERLKSLGIRANAAPPPTGEPTDLPAGALVTTYDQGSSRLVEVAFKRRLGRVQVVSLLVNERTGIVSADTFDSSWPAAEFVRRNTGSLRNGAVAAYEIPVAYALALAKRYMGLNTATRTGLPAEFLAVAPLFPPPVSGEFEPLIYRSIRPIELQLDPAALEECGRVLEEPDLQLWLLAPPQLDSAMQQFDAALKSPFITGPDAETNRTRASLDLLHDLLWDETTRGVFRRQLEEAAYCFISAERQVSAKRALAAGIALTDQPLLRSTFSRLMVSRTVTRVLGVPPPQNLPEQETAGLWTP